MFRVSFVFLSAVSYFIATPVFSQENISNQDFEERHAAAVSGISAKLSIGYSYIDNGRPDPFVISTSNTIDPSNAITIELPNNNEFEGFFVEGAVNVPIDSRFAVQFDGVYSRQSTNLGFDLSVLGAGVHVLWRTPKGNHYGIYGQYIDYDRELISYQIGGEAKFYNENLALELFAGLEQVDFDFGTRVTDDDQGFFAGEAILAYYPKPNLRLSAGIAHYLEETNLLAGFEWQLNQTASSVFVDTQFGENIFAARAGISLSFGQSESSLFQQHRDGPIRNRLLNSDASIEACLGQLFDEVTVNTFQPRESFSSTSFELNGCSVE